MINKYIHSLNLIYEKINNLIEIGKEPSYIAEELYTTHRLEVQMFKIPPDMIINFYEALAQQCYYDKNKNHNYITNGGSNGSES